MSENLEIITKNTDIDAFFMRDIWTFDDLAAAEDITLILMRIYANILAKYHNLPEKDTYHLSREMTYHSISVFLDTCLRLKKFAKNEWHGARDNDYFNQRLDDFFEDRSISRSLGNSRILRSRLINLIAFSLGRKDIFDKVNSDPVEIRLEAMGIKPAKEQNIWLSQYYLSKLLDKISSTIKIYLNKTLQKINGNLIRIGYIEIDKKYFLQIPDIKFVPLGIDLTPFLGGITTDKRRDFYDSFLADFLKECKSLDALNKFIGMETNEKLLSILFASLILKSEPLLLDCNKLRGAKLFCKDKIESKNVRALFSVGNWFRFPNAIIAAVGKKMGLPVIEYQLGGRCVYKIGQGSGHGESNTDYHLVWGQWTKNHQQNISGKLLKTPSPYLYELNNRGNRRKIKYSKRFNILYSSIGLSHLFRVDNNFSFNPDQIKSHRLSIQNSLEELDENEYSKNINLFVKVKGFDYALYKGYEYMLFPRLELRNIKVKYIFNRNSESYLDFVNLHFLDGLGTSFVFSLAYNIRSLVFLNKNVLKIYPQYMPLINRTIELGIVATNPSEVRMSIERYYSEPDYWFRNEIQEIRKEYLNIFGYFNKNWREEIGLQLTLITKENIETTRS